MVILAIETSCDETAVSVVEALGDFPHAKYAVLGDALFSQIEIHREYGGVFPNVAKREHTMTLVPMLEKALEEARLPLAPHAELFHEQKKHLEDLLTREQGLADNLISFYERYNTPAVDLITVTNGPGLEPALWVGVNFAKALAYLWQVPVVPVNHMEGHVLSSVFDGVHLPELAFPALALLISGGHTELVLMKSWGSYELVGQTRDDAVGEAFDKVARMLGLPYPGGPEISRLAREAREEKLEAFVRLPRPMLASNDADFSFSGLKTAVRYAIADKELSDAQKRALARDFEDTVTEVLVKKTAFALKTTGAQSLIVGGGVSANSNIRKHIQEHFSSAHPNVAIYLPEQKMTTDNSVMIALAGHARMHESLAPKAAADLYADGTRSLAGA